MLLSGSVGLQIGGAYVQKGYTIDLELFGERITSTARLDYLEPALFTSGLEAR